MGKRTKRLFMGWGIFILIIVISQVCYDREYTNIAKEFDKMSSKNPLPDPSKGEPLYYSLKKDEWVYRSSPRAKASGIYEKPYGRSEVTIDDILNKKIPGYKKKTYWGEDPDIIWSDEGDEPSEK